MSPLRHRMIEDMQVRNLSSYTQRNYLYAIARLARHFAVSPADLGPEELRTYLTHLVEQRISFSYFNMIVAALRFLYTVTLERDWAVPRLPYQKQERRLPTVLSPEEVRRFLDTVPDLKMRTVLITAYATGLRVFEVVALRPGDIAELLALKDAPDDALLDQAETIGVTAGRSILHDEAAEVYRPASDHGLHCADGAYNTLAGPA